MSGRYRGLFREDMFDEGQKLGDPYSRTKFESEKLVRDEATVPWRVYRPGIVVGHSQTGEMDKIDGPYYFFKVIQRLRGAAAAVGAGRSASRAGKINVVPVDFVAAGDGPHRSPGRPRRAGVPPHRPQARSPPGQLINTFARAAHAPEFAMRIDRQMMNVVPKQARSMIAQLPPVRRITDQVLGDFGIPREVLSYIDYPSDYDSPRRAARARGHRASQVPALEAYADRLWDYWERNLDPDLFKDRSLRGAIEGKVVVITGASSGIGQAARA